MTGYRRHCEGCGKPLTPIEAALWSVCIDCTRARQKAVVDGRCRCRTRRRLNDAGTACLRCLGEIRASSDGR